MFLLVVVCLPAYSQSQPIPYQKGTIMAVERVPAKAYAAKRYTLLKEDAELYDISIRVTDHVYLCRWQTVAGDDKSWISGKEAQVRIEGNTLYVKRVSRNDAKANVLRITQADSHE